MTAKTPTTATETPAVTNANGTMNTRTTAAEPGIPPHSRLRACAAHAVEATTCATIAKTLSATLTAMAATGMSATRPGVEATTTLVSSLVPSAALAKDPNPP